jgi:formylglycine-generating enzyme required for sulfatase activity
MGKSKWAVVVVGACLLVTAVAIAYAAGQVAKPPVEPAVAGRPAELVKPAPEVNPKAVVWRTPEPPKGPQAGDVWVNAKDGAEMVYVAEGEFILGATEQEVAAWLRDHPDDRFGQFDDEQPQRRVHLSGYWVGRTEVTNAQYQRFVRETGHAAPPHWQGEQVWARLPGFPVIWASWDDARTYCEWAGGRLPAEAEWEKAARGTDGRRYPWGNEWDVGGVRRCNFWSDRQADDGYLEASPVGSYPAGASPYGCLDMAGNGEEWCTDWYDAEYYQTAPERDPKGPAQGDCRSVRGGYWGSSPRGVRCATRYPYAALGDTYNFIGFRCARDAAR